MCTSTCTNKVVAMKQLINRLKRSQGNNSEGGDAGLCRPRNKGFNLLFYHQF